MDDFQLVAREGREISPLLAFEIQLVQRPTS